MTVVRLPSGALAVHSPVRWTAELHAAVEAVGEVQWLIAPNAFHHLFVADWQERFPAAQILAAPRLLAKRRDLAQARPLSDVPVEWQRELEVLPIDGLPLVNEYVFFHRASASLIATDLAFNFGPDSPFSARWLARLGGRFGELSPTLLERLLVRDRAALRKSLDQVLQWPFVRVVVAHGEVLESQNAREDLARGYDWVLKPST